MMENNLLPWHSWHKGPLAKCTKKDWLF